MLADFSLTSIIFDPGMSHTTSVSVAMKGTIPWMSPELLDPERFGLKYSKSTKPTDVYALGMVILEVCPILSWSQNIDKHSCQVLTRALPYTGSRPETISHTVLSGRRPPRPGNASSIGLSDNVWMITRQCWLQIAEHRPEVPVVTKFLNDASRQWEPRSVTKHEGFSRSNGTSTFVSKHDQEQTIIRTGCVSSSHSKCCRVFDDVFEQ
jgi:serine/threonine protein kinase